MNYFDYAVDVVLRNEGGLIDDPNDAGGITNMGISLRLYKVLHPDATAQDIRELTVDQAKEIYRNEFWSAAPFAEINSLRIATSVFDHAVNAGIASAVKVSQKACNALGAWLEVDGVMGKQTLGAINMLNAPKLLAEVRKQRAEYYKNLADEKPELAKFLNGWLTRIANT